MSTGNDSILDAYLYETNTLLEQLDSIVLASEEKDTFSEEDINTIFRIMHTIKGSSAMMEYRSIMTIAHRAEDLFSIIRTSPWTSSQRPTALSCSSCFSRPSTSSVRRSIISKMGNPLLKISTACCKKLIP